MKKLRIVRYLAYFTIILTLLSVLPGSALSAKDSSEQGNEKPESVYPRKLQRPIYR